MKLELVAAPPAGAAGRTGRASGATDWQQQLQRAQAAGWFCRSDRLPVAEGTPDRPFAQHAQRPVRREPQMEAGRRPAPAARLPATVAPATLASLAAGSAPVAALAGADPVPAGSLAAVDQRPAANESAGGVALPMRGARPAPDAITAPGQRPSPSSPAAGAESPAVRIHIEEGPQGLRFWLGLDGTPADVATRAGALAAELRRQCERAGLEVANVTCNGLSVAGAAPAPVQSTKEP